MLKRVFLLFLLFSVILNLKANLSPVPEKAGEFDSCLLYLQIKSSANENEFKDLLKYNHLLKSFNCSQMFPGHSDEALKRIYFIRTKSYKESESIFKLPELNGILQYIEYAPLMHFFLTPNDLHANQWHLKKIDAEQAWSIRTGNQQIRIAIVDDAVDLGHEDLKNIMYKNTADIAGNGIDDDGNGYTDDINGWHAFYKYGNPNPPFGNRDKFSHGTHCAGIAAAHTNNNTGIASISYNVSIIPVACSDSTKPGRVMSGYEGIVYAADAGANVISLSWGGSGFSNTGQITIDYARNKGIVICAAAGNSNVNTKMYPAAYNGVIAVAASDNNDKKASFSNYGTWVDISAPGVGIWSSVTGMNVRYDYMSGTSMACPLTAGLCALMLSQNPTIKPDQLEACLKSSSDNIQAMNPSYSGSLGAGRINARKALLCIKPLYADFKSDLQIICPGATIKFTNLSATASTEFIWRIPGASPSFSTLKDPQFTFANSGFYNVKLVVKDGNGNSDSTEMMKYIEVRAAKAKMLTPLSKIAPGESAFLSVGLEGVGPWDFKITDGSSTVDFTGINSNPFYFDVSPTKNTKYYLIAVSDSRCQGTYSDTSIVLIDTGKKVNSGTKGCGKFDLFSKTIDFGSNELPQFVYRLKDGNIAVAGISNKGLLGGDDIFISKFNVKGDLIWTRYYGTNKREIGYPVGITEDNLFNLYIFGGVFLNTYNTSFLCKIDSAGNILRSEVSVSNPVSDQIRAATELSNGKMLFVGTSAVSSSQAAGVYMAEPNGSKIWSHSFNSNPHTEHFIDVMEMNKRIYILGHTSNGSGTYGSMLVKMDFAGNTIFQKYVDYALYDGAMFIQPTHQSGIMLATWMSYNNTGTTFGEEDFGIFHCDSNGNRIWSKIFGQSGKDEVCGLLQFKNYYYVAGVTKSFDAGNSKLFLMKLDINGNIQWSKIYGESGERLIKPTFAKLLTFASDSSIILFGQKTGTTEDIIMFKIDECGNSSCPSKNAVFNVQSENTSVSNSNLTDLGLLNTTSIVPGVGSSGFGISIADKCPPVNPCKLSAGFVYDYACLKDSVRFKDTSIDLSGKKIAYRKWIFHDNSSASGINAAYKYNANGIYKVTLVAYSDTPWQCTDTIVRFITLNSRSFAKLEYGPTDICLYDSVNLRIKQLCGNPPYTVQWTPAQYFADPASLNPSIAPPVSMFAKFVLTDQSGLKYTDSVYINVNKNCCVYNAVPVVSGYEYCVGSQIDVINKVKYTGTGSQFKWYVYIDDVLVDSLVSPDLIGYKLNSPGKYTFRIRISGSCKTSENQVEVFVYPLPLADAGRDTFLCKESDVLLGAEPIANHEYLWTPVQGLDAADIARPLATIKSGIRYYLKVKNLETSCENVDTVEIVFHGKYQGFGNDTSMCEGSSIRFVAGKVQSGVTYTWNDGSNGPVKVINRAGRYIATMSNACGSFSDTVDVSTVVCFCDLILPNAFSPDGNGINEYFPEQNLDTIISLQIFNRWGEKLYEQKGTAVGWDGKYKGVVVQQDVYLFLIEYRNCYGRYAYKHGTFTLLR